MTHHPKDSPFYIKEANLAAWQSLSIKQLEEMALNLTTRIDGLPPQSVSFKEVLTDTLRELDFYIEKRKEKEEQQKAANEKSSTDNRR